MTPEFTFDYDDFQAKLYQATRRAVTDLFAEHPHETFYALGYYTSNTRSSLHLTANTEEGLTTVAEEYLRHGNTRGLNLTQMCWILRDNPPDWKYHCFSYNDPEFQMISELMSQGWNWYTSLIEQQEYKKDEASFEIYLAYTRQLIEICLTVLERLDQEGLFGTGSTRNQLRLNLMTWDENSINRLPYVRRLNSEVVCYEYEKEIFFTETIKRLLHSN